MATSTIKKNFSITAIFNHSAAEIGGATGAAFACNWQDYDMLLVCARHYSNVRETILVPVSYFSTTSYGTRVLFKDPIGDITYEFYQNGNGSVYAKTSSTAVALYLFVYGIKLG